MRVVVRTPPAAFHTPNVPPANTTVLFRPVLMPRLLSLLKTNSPAVTLVKPE